MKLLFATTMALSVLAALVDADCYMHTPRGSNNRNNEKSAQRTNGNRVFDSQNNGRGGYNVGDKYDKAAGADHKKQYQMNYLMSPLDIEGQSVMPIEWTNQHGCGGKDPDNPHKLNCNIVIQMMCQPYKKHDDSKPKYGEMRDGVNTNTNNYQSPNDRSETYEQFRQRWTNQEDQNRVLQEPFQWYDKCDQRERNKGLFTSDQKLKGHKSKYTRQNNQGTRRGYECPEERDYYPYWHPTHWKDIMVLSENASRCDYYKTESFNVKPKHECVEKWQNEKPVNPVNPMKHYSKHNNEYSCKEHGGDWVAFHNYLEILSYSQDECTEKNNTEVRMKGKLLWGRPMNERTEKCLVKLDPPECKLAPFSRVNHLGNGAEDMEPLHVWWKIPGFPSKQTQKCVLRIRYNISTDDYDPYRTDARYNKDGEEDEVIRNNPRVEIGLPGQNLQLAINTAQFGRTFQDRSHVFKLHSFDNIFTEENQTFYTVQVRGKRGNIVQTFPAVEYDFFPTNLNIKKKDMVYFSWTGSNTHNNGNPAGDGQAGDAGQGTGGTDRHNLASIGDRNTNFILPALHENSICQNIRRVIWSGAGPKDTKYPIDTEDNVDAKLDACIQLMSSGYYKCFRERENCFGYSLQTKSQMNNLLNNAPASFEGIVVQLNAGTYNYTCTRNNAYTNRSQKATLVVAESQEEE